ncbi:MAG: hypothetical protein OEY14_06765, partial [Myxococcales bacterium]|nr:hypothetical protein [Myxococcales bacterium]
ADELSRSRLDVLIHASFTEAYRDKSIRTQALFSLMEIRPELRAARTSDGALQYRLRGSFGTRIRPEAAGSAPSPRGAPAPRTRAAPSQRPSPAPAPSPSGARRPAAAPAAQPASDEQEEAQAQDLEALRAMDEQAQAPTQAPAPEDPPEP